jgi:predicted GNAT family N-acyltransferase
VFVVEQGVTLAADRDGRDGESLHLVAVQGGRVVATCRLLLDGEVVRLGRMVVDPALRGTGLGTRLLELADETSLSLGGRRIVLHAQVPSRGVYDRAGYTSLGEPFTEEGIEHVTMEKALA